MFYLIIGLLILIIFYLTGTDPAKSSQPSLMSSKYNGLVSSIFQYNSTSKIERDEITMMMIKSKVSMTNGETTYIFTEKSNGDLEIFYNSKGDDKLKISNFEFVVTYSQNICKLNHELVWEALKENIENIILERTKSSAQDLVNNFYGTTNTQTKEKPLTFTEKYNIKNYFIATITRIYDELIISTSNAEKAICNSYILTDIKFLNGPLLGKEYFGRRISLNECCDLIVSQTVYVAMFVHINEDGTKAPAFYIFEKEELTAEELNKASLS